MATKRKQRKTTCTLAAAEATGTLVSTRVQVSEFTAAARLKSVRLIRAVRHAPDCGL